MNSKFLKVSTPIIAAVAITALVIALIGLDKANTTTALLAGKADTTSVQLVKQALTTKADQTDLTALAKAVNGVSHNVKVLSQNDSVQTAAQTGFAKSLANINSNVDDVERRVVNAQKTANRNSFQQLVDMGYSRQESWKGMNQMALNPSSKLWKKFQDESPTQKNLPLPANLPPKK